MANTDQGSVQQEHDVTPATHLGILAYCISRWSGRLQAEQVEVKAEGEAGLETIENEKLTLPRMKLDTHEIFGRIDANRRAIEMAMRRYTVKDINAGMCLYSVLSAPTFFAKLAELRDERLLLAHELQSKWPEILEGIKTRFPHHYESQIKNRLPTQASLIARFDMRWDFFPLAVTRIENLNLDTLSESQRDDAIESVTMMAQQQAQARFQFVFDQVFGEMLQICDAIVNKGELDSGKRKTGAINEILDVLDRINDFGMFATGEVKDKVRQATAVIRAADISDINGNDTVRQGIKDVLSPLRVAIQHMAEEGVPGLGIRTGRSIEL